MIDNNFVGLLGINIGVLPLILIVVGLIAVGLGIGILINKLVVEKRIKSAKLAATNIINEANQNAKTIQKEAVLSAQEEVLKLKNQTEEELRLRRAEMDKMNDRFLQREEFINKKEQSLENN